VAPRAIDGVHDQVGSLIDGGPVVDAMCGHDDDEGGILEYLVKRDGLVVDAVGILELWNVRVVI